MGSKLGNHVVIFTKKLIWLDLGHTASLWLLCVNSLWGEKNGSKETSRRAQQQTTKEMMRFWIYFENIVLSPRILCSVNSNHLGLLRHNLYLPHSGRARLPPHCAVPWKLVRDNAVYYLHPGNMVILKLQEIFSKMLNMSGITRTFCGGTEWLDQGSR